VESLQARLMRVSTFAYLRNAQDGTEPAVPGGHGARVGARGAVDASTAVVDSEILALPDGLLQQFMAAEPGLADFRHMLTTCWNCARTGWAPRPNACWPRWATC
jgi:oligoendopeptidase F